MSDYLYIVSTIVFTTYGQLIMKWQVSKVGPLPERLSEKLLFLATLLFNPWIISGMMGAFLAMLSWFAAMTKFQLSFAYPILSLAFVLVLVFSIILLHEPVSLPKFLGVALIICGIFVATRG